MEIACEDIVFVRYVSRESFDPAPKVDSIVLTFRVKKNRNTQEEQELHSLWKRAFAHPRKTLISNLKQHPEYSIEKISDILEKLGYTTQVRAEAIAIADWKNIIQSL
jgi:16S rRNA A1518/A1519 N6-dimethyltransferase RsmA/KsgA/DIM1 with predicted DNA glycosylase/AP lyase activity